MKPSTNLMRAVVFLIKTESMTDPAGNAPTVANRLDFLKEQLKKEGTPDAEIPAVIAEAVRIATDGKGYPEGEGERPDLH